MTGLWIRNVERDDLKILDGYAGGIEHGMRREEGMLYISFGIRYAFHMAYVDKSYEW